MSMDRRIAAAALFAALALSASTVSAAPPDAAKAARDATRAAKAVTVALLQRGGSGTNLGTVTLQRIGSTRSRIRVQLANPAAAGTRVTLHGGTDCHDPHFANAARSMLLNPFTGRVSETIVSLPLTNLHSGKYLVAVQNQTARQQFIDACAQLSGP
jgi:hypothetical protein